MLDGAAQAVDQIGLRPAPGEREPPPVLPPGAGASKSSAVHVRANARAHVSASRCAALTFSAAKHAPGHSPARTARDGCAIQRSCQVRLHGRTSLWVKGELAMRWGQFWLVSSLIVVATAAMAGSGNQAHDVLLAMPADQRAAVLGRVVGEGCVGASALFKGMEPENKAGWSVRCMNGKSYGVWISPDAAGSTRVLELFRTQGHG